MKLDLLPVCLNIFNHFNIIGLFYIKLDMQFAERMHKKVLQDIQFRPDTPDSERNAKLNSLFNDLTCTLEQSVKGMNH